MRSFIIAILLLVSSTSFSQQNYFLYLQSDNRQPFYVKIGQEIYSASAAGYAIIPKLEKQSYDLQIGFPKNEFPAQNFTVNVAKDAGYAIKNFGAQGWALFDIQNLTTIAANTSKPKTIETEDKSNAFANVLSEATNNPSLTKTSVAVKEPVVKEPVEKKQLEKVATTVPVAETKSVEEQTNNVQEVSAPIIKETKTTAAATGIKKFDSILDADGRSLRYSIVNEKGNSDTVMIFIPYDNVSSEAIAASKIKVEGKTAAAPKLTTQTEPKPKAEVSKEKTITPVAKTNEKAVKKTSEPANPFLDIEINNPNAVDTSANKAEESNVTIAEKQKPLVAEEIKTAPPAIKEVPQEKENTARLSFNSDCVSLATAENFLALRSKMASEKDEAGMRYAAVKDFKQRCYTTNQIKNLSVLFLTQKGKYDFFDEAYPFVSDSNNFPLLEQELTDTYFIKRFKAMVEL